MHRGGDPQKPGEVVPRGVPGFLDGLPIPAVPAQHSGRRQLADWLTHPDHPLVARVMVNRIWQQHFGRGIVATPSNFGSRGARPTHPHLLDWLASEFRAAQWSIKHLHRLMLASQTYRLSSRHDGHNATLDPANEYLWRYSRRRLDAEAIRDSLLTISGQLSLLRPGPHPFPPITDWSYTQHNQFRDFYASQHRSVYLMTPRLQRHPFLALFDGPDTNVTTAGRRSSTVPAQALYLMNSEDVAAAAAALARSTEMLGDPRRRLQEIFQRTFQRPPSQGELVRVDRFLMDYAAQGDAESALGRTVPVPVGVARSVLLGLTEESKMRHSRRDFVRQGLTLTGAVGLTASLGTAAQDRLHPLAPAGPHFLPQAKRLIKVFLTGGVSHVDTFDEKPRLARDHGKIVSAAHLRGVSQQPLQASPFRFSSCGESGLRVSELFPNLGALADDLCVIRTLHTDIVEHFQAALAMHTGSATVPLPSLGAWLSYGLGTDNPDLPPYVVLCEHLPYGGSQLWDANFLPPMHQGVRVLPGAAPIPNLEPRVADVTLRQLESTLLDDFQKDFANARPQDLAIAARSRSFQTARGMMRVAPQVFDASREATHTRQSYGVGADDQRSFAWQCLVARRLIESGVRVVEIIDSGASNNWDSHGDMQSHRPMARRVDRSLAALLADLKQRGLFDDTLLAICTEFGRTPFDAGKGRNHWHRAFSCLLAGAGVRGGMAFGQSDEYGIAIASDPVHVHDYHATILHVMGIDHRRLTYRYAGRDFRLTDVRGNVVQDILA